MIAGSNSPVLGSPVREKATGRLWTPWILKVIIRALSAGCACCGSPGTSSPRRLVPHSQVALVELEDGLSVGSIAEPEYEGRKQNGNGAGQGARTIKLRRGRSQLQQLLCPGG